MSRLAVFGTIILILSLSLTLVVGCPTDTDFSIEITSVTSPVCPGESATLEAQTTPGADCDITVYYKSGPSTASGLYPKTADSDGYVSWTWKVGTNTTPGSWRIVVSASYDSQTASDSIYFTVQ